MTRHPATVRPDATVAEAARLMDRHHVSCLLVVDAGGRLAGAVGPRDLLRVFMRPDSEIRHEIIDEVLADYLGTNPALVSVNISDGVVTLAGEVELKSMLPSVSRRSAPSTGSSTWKAGSATCAVDDSRHPLTTGLARSLTASGAVSGVCAGTDLAGDRAVPGDGHPRRPRRPGGR